MCPAHYARWRRLNQTEFCHCGSPVYAKGLCVNDYAKSRRPPPKLRPKECSICGDKVYAKGLCKKDYGASRRPSRKILPTECSVCGEEVYVRGFCAVHYRRFLRHGDPNVCWEGTSAGEDDLANFIEGLGAPFERGTRQVIAPQELDIYFPDRYLAIEYNGLHWHSEKYRDRDHHRGKWIRCRELGIQLVQIWEDDWKFRRSVVEGMLRRKVLGSGSAIGARQTELVDLSKAQSDAFLAEHHVQGGASGSQYVGLSYGGALVGVTVFKRRRDGTGELARHASSLTIHGGLRKAMASTPYTDFVTFADHCVSDGRLYEATGWVESGQLQPDYRYVVDGRREHKFGYRIERFRRDPELMWEEGLTERELAELNGLPRIWDAGKTRYVFHV